MEITKYHGCGNDFLIAMNLPLSDAQKKQLVIALCKRHTGIGADGFIFVSLNPVEMIYYNRDGSRAWMCGNGIRCFARYLFDTGKLRKDQYIVRCGPHEVMVKIQSHDPFIAAIDLGIPTLSPRWIQSMDHQKIWGRTLTVNGRDYMVDTLYIQTIHTVVQVENFDDDCEEVGAKLHCHPLFTAKSNVNFAQRIHRKEVRILTYERGVGMTNACGTGCAAVAWDMWKRGLVDPDVTMICKQGSLHIHIDPRDGAVTLSGGAQPIMSGTIFDDWLSAYLKDDKDMASCDHDAYCEEKKA